MKLRIACPDPNAAPAGCPPGVMLSPDGLHWCSVDGGSAGAAWRPRAVVLTGHAHHRVAPLLDLRHGDALDVYATPAVFEHLTHSLPVLPVLQQYCGVKWHLLPVAGEQQRAEFTIALWPQWSFTVLRVPSTNTNGPAPEPDANDVLALALHDTETDTHLLVLPRAPLPHEAADYGPVDCVVVRSDAASAHPQQWAGLDALPAARKVVLGHGPARLKDTETPTGGTEIELW